MPQFMQETWWMVLLGVVLLVLCYVATPLLAARKGCAWYLWILGAGCLLPLIILMFLPFANRPEDPADIRERRRRTGNTIGLVFTVLGALGILVNLLQRAADLR
jgi:hypothetical protein